MSEQNKAIARRVFEMFDSGDLLLVDELYAQDYVAHNPFPDQSPGLEGMKESVKMMSGVFPDMSVKTEDQIAEGDKVVTRWTATGTHGGEFMGIPATNKQITVTGIIVDRFAGGKIVEHWEQFDSMGMIQQMGAIPGQ